jgi:hypothetical protein
VYSAVRELAPVQRIKGYLAGEVPVVRYTPPKSRIWGHQVGRLTASQVIERGLRFLNAQCTNVAIGSSTINVSDFNSSVPTAVQAITSLWGAQPRMHEGRDFDGSVTRNFEWDLPEAQLLVAAQWFDSVRQQPTRGGTPATCTYWSFDWPGPTMPSKRAAKLGGMLGLHLGCPHRVTTVFTFRDLEHYFGIKAYLSEIGLVDLSDKHVRPKLGR